jgi:hypothetical protein
MEMANGFPGIAFCPIFILSLLSRQISVFRGSIKRRREIAVAEQ